MEVSRIWDTNPGLAEQIGNDWPRAKSVLDIMATKEGRDWWKENGDDLDDARFDLTEGSRSRRVLAAYLNERAKMGAKTNA